MKLLFVLIFFVTSYLQSQQLRELRAVKITNVDSNVLFSDQSIAEAMDYLASIGVNAILPVVWNGAYTQYQSSIMERLWGNSIDPDFKGRDPLERIIIEAHRVGIEVYPWFEYGFASWYSGSNSTDGGPILKKFPSWALRTSDGKICNKNGFDWMSAINPEVQNFISSLVNEVITNYEVDGIEFSDRIPAIPVEGGYDSVTVSIYKLEHNGKNPPANFRDPEWMRWRADKLNEWLYSIDDLLENHNKDLFLSSSPSIYPWAYQEYLQDSYSWIRSGKIDHLIPQLYRYTFTDYIYELNNAINNAGAENLPKLFSGILMNIGVGSGAYLIPEDFLIQSIQANRDRKVMGEAFFYYEGIRKNNNQLGELLKNRFYTQKAHVPERKISPWRIPGLVINEDEELIIKSGSWESYPMRGFKGTILRTSDNTNPASILYRFNVPVSAYYDVYAYVVSNLPWTKQARYVIYPDSDSIEVRFDQSDPLIQGWQYMGTAYLSNGNSKPLFKIDNRFLEAGKYLTADAAMIILNRRLSPEVVTGIESQESAAETNVSGFQLYDNYPNPFNPATKLSWYQPEDDFIHLKIYNALGQEVQSPVSGFFNAGNHQVEFNAQNLSSGIYYYRILSTKFSKTKKMVLIK